MSCSLPFTPSTTDLAGPTLAKLHRGLRLPSLLIVLTEVVRDNVLGSEPQRAAASALVAFCGVCTFWHIPRYDAILPVTIWNFDRDLKPRCESCRIEDLLVHVHGATEATPYRYSLLGKHFSFSGITVPLEGARQRDSSGCESPQEFLGTSRHDSFHHRLPYARAHIRSCLPNVEGTDGPCSSLVW